MSSLHYATRRFWCCCFTHIVWYLNGFSAYVELLVTSVASLYKYRCRVKCWYELTRRGFLTPSDCLVIIWCQLLLHFSVLLVKIQRNPQDFIVPINSFSVWPPTLLTTLIYSKQNVGEYGFTDKGINLSLLNRQLNRVWTLLFLREICLHTTLKPFG